MTIVDISSEPCDECRRRGWDPPWQLVVRLQYACTRKGGVVTASLCLAHHLTEFLAGYFESRVRSEGRTGHRHPRDCRQADDRHQAEVKCDGEPDPWSSSPASTSQRGRAGFRLR